MATTEQEILDRQAIVEVIDRYGLSLDAKDYARFQTCFTRDAKVTYEGLDQPLDGPEATAAFCERALASFIATQHLLGNYDITIDGDRASAQTYLHATHVAPPESGGAILIVGGTYVDELVRTPEGWKIAERELVSRWRERRETNSQ